MHRLRRESGGAGCVGLARAIDQYHSRGILRETGAQAQELGEGQELLRRHAQRATQPRGAPESASQRFTANGSTTSPDFTPTHAAVR